MSAPARKVETRSNVSPRKSTPSSTPNRTSQGAAARKAEGARTPGSVSRSQVATAASRATSSGAPSALRSQASNRLLGNEWSKINDKSQDVDAKMKPFFENFLEDQGRARRGGSPNSDAITAAAPSDSDAFDGRGGQEPPRGITAAYPSDSDSFQDRPEGPSPGITAAYPSDSDSLEERPGKPPSAITERFPSDGDLGPKPPGWPPIGGPRLEFPPVDRPPLDIPKPPGWPPIGGPHPNPPTPRPPIDWPPIGDPKPPIDGPPLDGPKPPRRLPSPHEPPVEVVTLRAPSDSDNFDYDSSRNIGYLQGSA